MGQYYMPALFMRNENGTLGRMLCTLYSHSYDNGLKLTEHSYMGNAFVNAVLAKMIEYQNSGIIPAIAWIGDYSNSSMKTEHCVRDGIVSENAYMNAHSLLWRDGNTDGMEVKPDPLPLSDPEAFDGYYLVNHTKCTYIDLGAFYLENNWTETWNNESWIMCFHPLPLLTAIGNGLGGGDYPKSLPDFDRIGEWAFCQVEFCAEKPDGYRSETFNFKEQHNAE